MPDMSDQTTPKPTAPAKEAPEALQLRARPSLVARLDRRVIATLAGTTCALLCGATIYALDPPGWASEADAGPELYNVDRKPFADGLNAMPASYDQVEPPPEFGPPLPGDLGKAWHDAQTGNLGLQGPDPEAERRRQEELRRQQELAEARTSGLFFQLDTEREGGRQNGGRAAPLPDMPNLAGLDPARLAQVGAGGVPAPGDRRLAFLDQGQDASIYSAHGLQTPASPYQVMAGTIIPASTTSRQPATRSRSTCRPPCPRLSPRSSGPSSRSPAPTSMVARASSSWTDSARSCRSPRRHCCSGRRLSGC
jgi:type IV secretion system protein VirB10